MSMAGSPQAGAAAAGGRKKSSQIQRITKYPEVEGTHQDYGSPAPNPAQNSSKNPPGDGKLGKRCLYSHLSLVERPALPGTEAGRGKGMCQGCSKGLSSHLGTAAITNLLCVPPTRRFPPKDKAESFPHQLHCYFGGESP